MTQLRHTLNLFVSLRQALALFLAFTLALPTPAFGLRQLNAGLEDNPLVNREIEEQLLAGLEEKDLNTIPESELRTLLSGLPGWPSGDELEGIISQILQKRPFHSWGDLQKKVERIGQGRIKALRKAGVIIRRPSAARTLPQPVPLKTVQEGMHFVAVEFDRLDRSFRGAETQEHYERLRQEVLLALHHASAGLPAVVLGSGELNDIPDELLTSDKFPFIVLVDLYPAPTEQALHRRGLTSLVKQGKIRIVQADLSMISPDFLLEVDRVIDQAQGIPSARRGLIQLYRRYADKKIPFVTGEPPRSLMEQVGEHRVGLVVSSMLHHNLASFVQKGIDQRIVKKFNRPLPVDQELFGTDEEFLKALLPVAEQIYDSHAGLLKHLTHPEGIIYLSISIARVELDRVSRALTVDRLTGRQRPLTVERIALGFTRLAEATRSRDMAAILEEFIRSLWETFASQPFQAPVKWNMRALTLNHPQAPFAEGFEHLYTNVWFWLARADLRVGHLVQSLIIRPAGGPQQPTWSPFELASFQFASGRRPNPVELYRILRTRLNRTLIEEEATRQGQGISEREMGQHLENRYGFSLSEQEVGQIFQELDLHPGELVLEIGPGHTLLPIIAALSGVRVMAVEPSPKYGVRLKGMKAQVEDLITLAGGELNIIERSILEPEVQQQLADESFDHVWAVDVIVEPETAREYREMERRGFGGLRIGTEMGILAEQANRQVADTIARIKEPYGGSVYLGIVSQVARAPRENIVTQALQRRGRTIVSHAWVAAPFATQAMVGSSDHGIIYKFPVAPQGAVPISGKPPAARLEESPQGAQQMPEPSEKLSRTVVWSFSPHGPVELGQVGAWWQQIQQRSVGQVVAVFEQAPPGLEKVLRDPAIAQLVRGLEELIGLMDVLEGRVPADQTRQELASRLMTELDRLVQEDWEVPQRLILEIRQALQSGGTVSADQPGSFHLAPFLYLAQHPEVIPVFERAPRSSALAKLRADFARWEAPLALYYAPTPRDTRAFEDRMGIYFLEQTHSDALRNEDMARNQAPEWMGVYPTATIAVRMGSDHAEMAELVDYGQFWFQKIVEPISTPLKPPLFRSLAPFLGELLRGVPIPEPAREEVLSHFPWMAVSGTLLEGGKVSAHRAYERADEVFDVVKQRGDLIRLTGDLQRQARAGLFHQGPGRESPQAWFVRFALFTLAWLRHREYLTREDLEQIPPQYQRIVSQILTAMQRSGLEEVRELEADIQQLEQRLELLGLGLMPRIGIHGEQAGNSPKGELWHFISDPNLHDYWRAHWQENSLDAMFQLRQGRLILNDVFMEPSEFFERLQGTIVFTARYGKLDLSQRTTPEIYLLVNVPERGFELADATSKPSSATVDVFDPARKSYRFLFVEGKKEAREIPPESIVARIGVTDADLEQVSQWARIQAQTSGLQGAEIPVAESLVMRLLYKRVLEKILDVITAAVLEEEEAAQRTLDLLAVKWGLVKGSELRIAAVTPAVLGERAGLEELVGKPIRLGQVRLVIVPRETDRMDDLLVQLMSETNPLIMVQTYGGLEEKALDQFESKARYVGFTVLPRILPHSFVGNSLFRQLIANLAGLEEDAIQEEDLIAFEQALGALA